MLRLRPSGRISAGAGRHHVRFDDGEHVLLVDLDDGVHAAHVELQCRIRVLDGTGPVIPAGPMRLHLEAVPVGVPHDRLHFFGGAREARRRPAAACSGFDPAARPLPAIGRRRCRARRRRAKRARRRRCPRACGRRRRVSAASAPQSRPAWWAWRSWAHEDSFPDAGGERNELQHVVNPEVGAGAARGRVGGHGLREVQLAARASRHRASAPVVAASSTRSAAVAAE